MRKLKEIGAYGLAISERTDGQLVDTADRPGMGFTILDLRQPFVKNLRAPQFVSHIKL